MGLHGRALPYALVALLAARPRPRPRRRLARGRPRGGRPSTRGWRFQKGDAAGAEKPGFDDARLARARPAARLGDRGAVRPDDQPAPGVRCRSSAWPGTASASTVPGVGPGPALRDRDRRGDVERDRLPERPRAGRPAVRLHRLRARPDAAPRLRRRERARRPPRARAGVLALVPRRGPLPPRLDRRHGPGARGALGHLRDDAGRDRRRGDGRDPHRAAQPRGASRPRVTLETAILDAGGREVAREPSEPTVPAGGDGGGRSRRITVPTPARWDLDRPYLYTAVSTVRRGDAVLDRYDDALRHPHDRVRPGQGLPAERPPRPAPGRVQPPRPRARSARPSTAARPSASSRS